MEKTPIKAVESKAEFAIPDGKCCARCQYCTKLGDDKPTAPLYCVINPPTVFYSLLVSPDGRAAWPGMSGWPNVKPHQWCGKFTARLDS